MFAEIHDYVKLLKVLRRKKILSPNVNHTGIFGKIFANPKICWPVFGKDS
jgi:hypothetical protein